MKNIVFACLFLIGQPLWAKPLVMTSFSILGDMVHQIGQDKIEVKSLVGPNEDSHVYEPRPQDAKALNQASLVVVNGLGFERWMTRLIENSGFKGPVLVATTGIQPLMHRQKGQPVTDPHAWHSLKNALIYVDNIVRALVDLCPQDADFFRQRGRVYKKSLEVLARQAHKKFETIPLKTRKVVTSHRAFAYQEVELQIQFIDSTGMSTESEPSAKTIAGLIHTCRKEKIRAIFLENMTNPNLIKQIAEETGVSIGGTLYSDALSPVGTEADTYLKMMTHNIRVLAEKLGEKPDLNSL